MVLLLLIQYFLSYGPGTCIRLNSFSYQVLYDISFKQAYLLIRAFLHRPPLGLQYQEKNSGLDGVNGY